MTPVRKAIPPGPTATSPLDNTEQYFKDPLGLAARYAKQYGDVVYVPLVGTSAYLLNHPDHIEYVLVQNSKNYVRDKFSRQHRKLLGNGLLANEGVSWRTQRRLMQPAFHRRRIAAYGDVVTAHAQRMAAGWKDNEIRDVYEDMMQLALEMTVAVIFGTTVGNKTEHLQAVTRSMINHLKGDIERPFQSSHQTSGEGPGESSTLLHELRTLGSVIHEIIEERHLGRERPADLLSLLLDARDQHGNPMSIRQLKDEIISLLVASHETTALTLTYTWHLLSQYPATQIKLLDELSAVLGGRHPTVEDLPDLIYTESVVKESMRLYPAIWSLTREPVKDDEIGGYHIPAKSLVIIPRWVVQRDHRFFDDPDEFRPERWNASLENRIPRFAYFPFGGGPRLCIGAHLAMMEIRLVVATLGQQIQFASVPDHPVRLLPSSHVRPENGVRMILRKR